MNKKEVSVVPFFITNPNTPEIGTPFYLYQVYSPCINEDNEFMKSLQLVGERTRKNDPHSTENKGLNKNQDAILKVMFKGEMKDALDNLKNNILRVGNSRLEGRKYKMPMWKEDDNNILRSLIVGIRDTVRWNEYRFNVGCLVDILLSPTEFGIYELVEAGNDKLKFEHKATYSCNDPGMTKPLENNAFQIKETFDNVPTRPSIINRTIRSLEWKALG